MPRPSSTSRERARPRLVAMKLVVALAGLSVAAASTIKRVGVVIAPGFELLDALGPYETLKEVEEGYYTQIDIANRTWGTPTGIACADGELNVTAALVAFFGGAAAPVVPSSSGVGIAPEFDLASDASATHFDLLVVPAGASTDATDDYVRRHHAAGGLVMSVCTGASVPAKLGLLDGSTATSNSLFLDGFRAEYPAVNWVSLADDLDTRFIRSTPQITTCAGITAGIDGALHQIGEWCGHDVAEATRQCLEWPLALEA